MAVALVSAADKKVPPRDPEQRLSTLGRFFDQFTSDIVAGIAGDGYAGRLNGRMQGMIASMGAAYARPNCGYFDETSKHGGPDPNPGQRPDGKPRNRRYAPEDLEEVLHAACDLGWESLNPTVQGECCEDDADFYVTNKARCDARPRAGKGKPKKDPYERLSEDPALKWKQITTGCRKWAERYIGNCAGQRKNNLIKNRTKRVYTKVLAKLGL